MSIQIIGKKCPRTHSPVSRSSSHHPCISVKQCQSFFKLSLYIPFLKKYFYSLYVVLTRTLRSGNPLLQWKFLEIGLEERIKIFVKILRQRARSPLAKHYFWIWRPLEDEIVNTLVNIAKYIIFLLLSSPSRVCELWFWFWRWLWKE